MSKLFYVIGASGAGKDSLMNYCRKAVDGALPIVFAHRYITRPIITDAENHIHLTDKEFQLRLECGLFALNWQSHGLHYGIGIEINHWLKKGLTVVVNGSREYLPVAMQKHPEMHPILIGADAENIKARLNNRGREDAQNIAARIARNEVFHLADASLIRIANNADLATAADELLTYLLPGEPIKAI